MLYRFQNPEPVTINNDRDTQGGSDEPNVYGEVVERRGNLRFRACGRMTDPLFSVWAGRKLIYTTENIYQLARFMN